MSRAELQGGARRRTERDERGATLPLVALAIVTLLTCAAMAVDIGSLAANNRRLQGVADLAAIAGSAELIGAACNYSYMLASDSSASSVFNHVRAAAVANATKNGFTVGGTKTLVVEVGTTAYSGGAPTFTPIWSTANAGDCTSAAIPTSVRVTAGDFTTFGFGKVVGQDGRTSSRSGTAGHSASGDTRGGFTIGSSVASVDSSSSPVLNTVLQGMVCQGLSGCSFSTTLVGYQGLATAGVTLGQLQTQLGLGSPTALLNASIKAKDLYLATAKALGCSVAAGCSNAAAVTLLGLATSVTSTNTFKLGSMITVASGSETAAAATTFNVFSLVTGSAELINGTNALSIPVTTVTIPGATSTTLSVKVIQVPQTYIGPVGGSVTTSQVQITATQQVNLLNLPATGVLGGLVSVTGSLTSSITAGSAKGTLTQVSCGTSRGEVVSVDTTGASTTFGDTNTANKFLSVKALNALGLPITVASLNVNGSQSVAGVSGTQLSFSYPSGYLPTNPSPTHVGGTTLNINTSTSVNSSISAVAGLVTIDGTSLTNSLVGSTGVLGLLDSAVVSPLLRALGITVGGADIWAIGQPGCGVPVLNG
jgi:uncharacterized membrane protein